MTLYRTCKFCVCGKTRNVVVVVVAAVEGNNREFKIRRLRTTATDKYATAHDQNHVTVYFSRVVL